MQLPKLISSGRSPVASDGRDTSAPSSRTGVAADKGHRARAPQQARALGRARAQRRFGGRGVEGLAALTWGDVTDADIAQGCTSTHGTHVGGSAAATDFGVASGAEIVTVQVLTCTDGTGSTAGVLEGMEFAISDAARHGRPSVISMSLSGGGQSFAYDRVVRQAQAAGIVTLPMLCLCLSE